MSYLRLRDERSGEIHEYRLLEVNVGRDPSLDLVAVGEGRKVVSAQHARFVHRDGSWWIEDMGSRNGTFVDDERLVAGTPASIRQGSTVRLGNAGPTFSVLSVAASGIPGALVEGDGYALADPDDPTVPIDEAAPRVPAGASPDREPFVVVRLVATGERYEVRGTRIRFGRAKECQIRPTGSTDTSVSRLHAEIEFTPDRGVLLRDLGSRNGTLLNGVPLDYEQALHVDDRVQLGSTGPEFLVDRLAGEFGAPPADVGQRSYGGKGATIFLRDLIEESSRSTKVRARWMVWSFVALLAGAVGAMYWVSEIRVRETEARLEEQGRLLAEQRELADSLQRAAATEYERARSELERARASAAPSAVLDSLRDELAEARERTDALEDALARTQADLDHQLSSGDSLQREAQQELARVRTDLSRAMGGEQTGLLDSLRRAVTNAESQAADIEAAIRAVRGSNLATVVQANAGAIGLVTAVFDEENFEGSGFVVTPSGYFVTNRHVVTLNSVQADSLYVTLNSQRRMLRADIVNVGGNDGPDLAVLKIRNFSGQSVRNFDWTGRKVRQGEPAALIGFPAGKAMALDGSLTVRASVNAGIISKITSETIQFDGFTVFGSSGSPIFNGNGEVIAVHRAGLKDAVGMGFAVPIQYLIPLLPPQAKVELGLN